jgi:hypothetical protein
MGMELLRSSSKSGMLDALEKDWLDMMEQERFNMWERSAMKLLKDPSFAPLLKAQGAKLTSTMAGLKRD